MYVIYVTLSKTDTFVPQKSVKRVLNVVLRDNILTKISLLCSLYGLSILVKLHFEFQRNHIGVLFFIHIFQIFPMLRHLRHKRIHSLTDHKNCPLSVLKSCPFSREFQHSKSY